MNKIKNIKADVFIASFSALALTLAMVSQHVFDMQPCAWCVGQRMIYMVIFVVSLISVFMRQKTYMLYTTTLLSLLGVGVAIYQSIVKKNPFACAQTIIDKIVGNLGLNKLAPEIFEIRVLCSEENATILGVQYVHISMVGFIVLLLLSIWGLAKNKRLNVL